MKRNRFLIILAACLLAGTFLTVSPVVKAVDTDPVLYHCRCGNKHSTALENGTVTYKQGTTRCYTGCDGAILAWTRFEISKTPTPGNYYLVDNATADNAANRSSTLSIGTASTSGTFNIDMNGLDYRTITNYFTAIQVGYNSTLNLCNTKTTGGTIYSQGPDGGHSGVLLLSNYHATNKTKDQTATVNLYGVSLARQAGTNTVTEAGAVKVTSGCTLNAYDCAITGGAVTGNGGSVLVESGGTVDLNNVRVSGGTAGNNGGNIYISNNAYATIQKTQITGGTAANNGGNLWAGAADKDTYGNLVLADCTVSGGRATGEKEGGGTGGNIVTARRTAINGGSVKDGTAANTAGNIFVSDAELVVQLTAQITGGNSGESDGGNVYITGTSGKLTMHDTAHITGGVTAGSGGNLYLDSGATATMSGSAYMAGGGYTGAYASGTAVAAYGGNVYVAENATFTMSGNAVVRNSMTTDASQSGNFCVYGTLNIGGEATVFGGKSGGSHRNIQLLGGSLHIYGSAKVDGGITCESGTVKLSGTPTVATYTDSRADRTICLAENMVIDAAGLSSGAQIDLYAGDFSSGTAKAASVGLAQAEAVKACFRAVPSDAFENCSITREKDDQGSVYLWLRPYTPEAQVVISGEGGYDYETVAEAISAAAGTGTVKLQKDVQNVNAAGQTLCLDLNGYDVTGTVTAATLHGVDSATRLYGRGVDGREDNTYGVIANIAQGTAVEPFYKYNDGTNTRRYLAVTDATGTSFHRYYMAITTVAIAPATSAFSYKAAFLGDSVVKAVADSGEVEYGMYFKAITETHEKATKAFVAGPYKEENLEYNYLRVSLQNVLKEGADNDSRVTLPVYAKAYMKSGGETDYSAEIVKSFNDVLKSANDAFASIDNEALRTALVGMYRTYSTGITSWTDENVGNIRGAAKAYCECGSDTNQHLGDCQGTALTWEPWDGKVRTGNFYLTADRTSAIALDSAATDFKLDLRGYDITVTDARAINIGAGKITVCDSEGGGTISGYGQAAGINAAAITQWGGKLTLYGVDVSAYNGGNSIANGGAVYVSGDAAVFNMYGGSLTGCAVTGNGGTLDLNKCQSAVLADVAVTGGSAVWGGNIYIGADASLTLSGSTTVTGGKDINQSSNIYNLGELVMNDRAQVYGGLWSQTSQWDKATNRNLRMQGSSATLTMTGTTAIDGGVTAQNVKAITLSGTPRICQLDESGDPVLGEDVRHLRIIGGLVMNAADIQPGAIIHVGIDTSGSNFAQISSDADDSILACFQGSEANYGGPVVRADATHLALYDSTALYHCACGSSTQNHMGECTGEKLVWLPWDGTVQAGNYYLTESTASAISLDSAATDFKLDLRGYDITVTDARAINIGAGKITVCDSTGGGTISGYGMGAGSANAATVTQWGGKLTLYGVDVGVYNGGNGIVNGGAVYVSGNTAVFHMYSGTVTGTKVSDKGGSMAVVTGASVHLEDVTVTDGTSGSGQGDDIYLNNASLTLNGTVRIDALYLGTGTATAVSMGADFDISGSDVRVARANGGTVLANVAQDYTGAIKSGMAGYRTATQNGALVLVAGDEYIYHCLCGNVVYNADGTVRRENRDGCYGTCDGKSIIWSPWDGSVKSGYFYLTADHTSAIALNSAATDFKLDLRGFDMKVTDARAINIGNGTITLCDSVGGSAVSGYGHEAGIDAASIKQWGGSLTLYGVNVSVYGGGNSIKSGGAAYISDAGAVFSMYGGTVTGTTVSERGGALAIVLSAAAYLEDVTVTDGTSGLACGDGIYLNSAGLTLNGTIKIGDLYLGSGETTKLTFGSGLDMTGSSIGISMADKTKPMATGVTKDLTGVIYSKDTAYADRYDAQNQQLVLDAAKIWVGHGRVDITPTESVPMGGYGNSENRWSNNVLSNLYATCIAITDENDETLLIFTADVINPSTKWAPQARAAVSQATGVPEDNIVIACTHQHSSPDAALDEYEVVAQWNASMVTWFRDAAVAAMEERKPAQMAINSVQTENLNFVRHYILSDGTYSGDNHNHLLGLSSVAHATEVDSQMQLIKFTRDGGKDIWMVNWQAHPHRAGGSKKYDLTADVVGEFRDVMEAELDCYFAYYSGASGNVNTTSRISSENVTADYKQTGQALAQYALSVQDSFTAVDNGLVGVKKVTFTGRVNHSQDAMLDDAKTIWELWKSSGYDAEATVKAGMALEPKIYSPFHANAIITKAGLGETRSFDIWTLSVGDIGFAIVPYEMFDTNGVYVKENSPFDMTFVLSQANYANGYIPSAEAYDYGCYEADTGRYERGTGETLAELYVSMLEALHNGQ